MKTNSKFLLTMLMLVVTSLFLWSCVNMLEGSGEGADQVPVKDQVKPDEKEVQDSIPKNCDELEKLIVEKELGSDEAHSLRRLHKERCPQMEFFDRCNKILDDHKMFDPRAQEQKLVKLNYYLCLQQLIPENHCQEIIDLTEQTQSRYGHNLYMKYCSDIMLPPVILTDNCNEIPGKTYYQSDDRRFEKPHYYMCKDGYNPQLCENVKKELERKDSPYGRAVLERYCRDTIKTTPPPKKPEVPENPEWEYDEVIGGPHSCKRTETWEKYAHEECEDKGQVLAESRPNEICGGFAGDRLYRYLNYNCKPKNEPTPDPKKCVEILDDMKQYGLEGEEQSLYKLHYKMCMGAPAQNCLPVIDITEQYTSKYGLMVYTKYCAELYPAPIPQQPVPETPTQDECREDLPAKQMLLKEMEKSGMNQEPEYWMLQLEVLFCQGVKFGSPECNLLNNIIAEYGWELAKQVKTAFCME